jgi:hypothetical protein
MRAGRLPVWQDRERALPCSAGGIQVSPRVAFTKKTPEGLMVDIEEFEGYRLLLLTKGRSGSGARNAQLLGVAGNEINSPTITWYYDYEPLPDMTTEERAVRWLEGRGYALGFFDQFGNFRAKAA